MWVDVNRMLENCPDEMKEDVEEITNLSRKFLWEVDIIPNQHIEEVKVGLQEAKNCLLSILSRFLTLISHNITKKELDGIKKSIIEIGLEYKFEEDMGEIIKFLDEIHPTKPDLLLSNSTLLKFAGEMRTVWDFIIFHPIITANMNSKNREEYIENIFKMIRTNTSIISQTGKVAVSVSKSFVPRPVDMIRRGAYKSGIEGEETEEEIEIPSNLVYENTQQEESYGNY